MNHICRQDKKLNNINTNIILQYCACRCSNKIIFKNDSMFTYVAVSKAQIQIGDPVNISWTAAFFPKTGQYNVYYTYKVNKTIFRIEREGISYGSHNVSNKFRYITRPYNSVNISFEIRYTTVDDAGYYAGGPTADSAWSGGGVVLIVSGKLFLFKTFLAHLKQRFK